MRHRGSGYFRDHGSGSGSEAESGYGDKYNGHYFIPTLFFDLLFEFMIGQLNENIKLLTCHVVRRERCRRQSSPAIHCTAVRSLPIRRRRVRTPLNINLLCSSWKVSAYLVYTELLRIVIMYRNFFYSDFTRTPSLQIDDIKSKVYILHFAQRPKN